MGRFVWEIEKFVWEIEKCSHLREKGGVLMLLKTTHHLEAKAQYNRVHSSEVLIKVVRRLKTQF